MLSLEDFLDKDCSCFPVGGAGGGGGGGTLAWDSGAGEEEEENQPAKVEEGSEEDSKISLTAETLSTKRSWISAAVSCKTPWTPRSRTSWAVDLNTSAMVAADLEVKDESLSTTEYSGDFGEAELLDIEKKTQENGI